MSNKNTFVTPDEHTKGPFLMPTNSLTSGDTISVTSRAQLLSAIENAKGGATIMLADGYYGNLDINNKTYNSQIKILSENPLGAKFETVSVSNSSNIRIDASF